MPWRSSSLGNPFSAVMDNRRHNRYHTDPNRKSGGLFLFVIRAPLLYHSDPVFEGGEHIEEAGKENWDC